MYEGKLIRLRAFTQQDIDPALQHINNYETVRCTATGLLYPSTYEDEARFIGQQTSYTRGEYQFAMETLAGEYLGGCGFNRVDWKNRVAEVGIMIGNPANRGKGYGTEALAILARFAFDEMNLEKLKLTVISYNEAAIGCYEKAGYQLEGRLRREVYREGVYHDLLCMGMLREEWASLHCIHP